MFMQGVKSLGFITLNYKLKLLVLLPFYGVVFHSQSMC